MSVKTNSFTQVRVLPQDSISLKINNLSEFLDSFDRHTRHVCGNETSESKSLEKDFGELENQSFISVMELIGSFHQPTFRQKLVKKIEQQKTSFETPSNYDANQWATVWTSSRSAHQILVTRTHQLCDITVFDIFCQVL